MSTWQAYLDEHAGQFLEELLDFLRIPSISALPDHAADVARAGEWVAARLRTAGLEGVRVLPTGGHPVVYGEWLHAAGKPTVLIYGHFDTQPADPYELWTSPPFEPQVRDGKVYARGATDDKGNMFTPILAVEALLKSEGALPVNVKFFFEGQEEIGSPQIPDFVAAHRELLACDLALSSDGGQWSETEPAILVGLRGGCGVQIDVRGANSDLHSGMYGGAVQNPIHALVMILDSLRGADGHILVDGFYDSIPPLSDADRAQIAEVPFDIENLHGGDRRRGAVRRARLHPARADMGAPDAGDQRHLGRLPGRWRQNRAAERGARQDHLPPGARPGSADDRAADHRARRAQHTGGRAGDHHAAWVHRASHT